jgi:uncharacterized damage-inducible protein DinB
MERQPVSQAAEPPSHVLCLVLDQLASVIAAVPAEVYRARFASAVTGSIGEHVRHCLDHVSALLNSTPAASLSYDSRKRGTSVETDPMVAVRQVSVLRSALTAWPARSIDEPIAVSAQLTAGGRVLTTWSTLARELAFVTTHTIHHQAIIGVLMATHGLVVPERFGHAPSTPTRH